MTHQDACPAIEGWLAFRVANRMQPSLAALDQLLDLAHPSVTMGTP